MTDREKVLAAYAFLIGRFGEDSDEADRFQELYTEELAGLIEVATLCRDPALGIFKP